MEEIKDKDLLIETYINSSKKFSIRITHLPTGNIVECSCEPYESKNKLKAMDILRLLVSERDLISTVEIKEIKWKSLNES